MKKQYESPIFEIKEIDVKDIITTSSTDENIPENNNESMIF